MAQTVAASSASASPGMPDHPHSLEAVRQPLARPPRPRTMPNSATGAIGQDRSRERHLRLLLMINPFAVQDPARRSSQSITGGLPTAPPARCGPWWWRRRRLRLLRCFCGRRRGRAAAGCGAGFARRGLDAEGAGERSSVRGGGTPRGSADTVFGGGLNARPRPAPEPYSLHAPASVEGGVLVHRHRLRARRRPLGWPSRWRRRRPQPVCWAPLVGRRWSCCSLSAPAWWQARRRIGQRRAACGRRTGDGRRKQARLDPPLGRRRASGTAPSGRRGRSTSSTTPPREPAPPASPPVCPR